jgi:hypothetical protein
MAESLELNVIYSDDYITFCKTLLCHTFEYRWDIKREYMYDIFDQVPKDDLENCYCDDFLEEYLDEIKDKNDREDK